MQLHLMGEPGYALAAEEAALRIDDLAAHPDAIFDVICTDAIWRAATSDPQALTGLERLRRISREVGGLQLCPTLVSAMLVEKVEGASQLPRELVALDDATYQIPYHYESLLANMVLARAKERRGDLAGALESLRRRWSVTGNTRIGFFLLPTLRQEGRLAALVGDTVGAIKAYEHYLTLRTDPDPEVQLQVDSVRAELAAVRSN